MLILEKKRKLIYNKSQELINMKLWVAIVSIIGALIVGLILGFFVARAWFKNYLKKNPPMNENMVRAMLRQMGRTPSEKQVRQIMASMEQHK